MNWQAVEQAIEEATGQPFRVRGQRGLGRGRINEAFVIEGRAGGISRQYFVKQNRAELLFMFAAESAGLTEILISNSVRAPQPICHGSTKNHSFIVQEYVELNANSAHSAQLLGEQLAAMHRHTAMQFGWAQDNTIGTTPQVNNKTSDWTTFYTEHRIGYQLSLTRGNGAHASLFDKGLLLLELLPAFFKTYQPLPSLLHGDLWGGNWATDSTDAPVIYDPAIYYGDRETDLAMTELFGGFHDRFYQSYRHAWPWDTGYETRKVLYNLYHVLNHFNLFGGSYADQAQDMINRLIAEVT